MKKREELMDVIETAIRIAKNDESPLTLYLLTLARDAIKRRRSGSLFEEAILKSGGSFE
jgi:hypothetical protein